MPPVPALYPSQGLAVDRHREQVLVDADRVGQPGRPVPVAMSWSTAAPTPMPVVVLSHGGAYGKTDPRASMDQWARLLAEHGYFSIAIAHVPRTDLERIVLTMNLGGTLPQCAQFKHLGFDRPLDLAVALRAITDMADSGPLAGLVDAETVGYMGHSGGAGSVMMAAGAGREYMPGLGLSYAAHETPLAFVAMSPEGVGDDGFLATSWDNLARPMLMGSGAADGDHPHERRDPYEYMPPGDKYLLWLDDPAATHTLFEAELDSCTRVTRDVAECEQMRDWLASAVRAFLDAHVRGDQAGADYLASDDLVTVSGGTIEWSAK